MLKSDFAGRGRGPVAFLALALSAAAARGEPAKGATLAIAGIEARGSATADDAALVSDALAAQLVQGGRLRLVERAQLARVMKEQALASSGAMSDEVQIKVAQLVGARFLAVGAVQGDGKGETLSLRAIDSSSAQVAYAETLRIGERGQLETAAKKLARALEAKLAGGAQVATAGGEPLGDFDAGEVRDGARALARSLALRFPKVEGKIVEALPNDTATCRFASVQSVFAGQRFEVAGQDEVTESEVAKGYFLLGAISASGCSGRLKRAGGANVGGGDTLRSLPLKISLDPLEAGPGTEPTLAKLFSDEARAALGTLPQFQLAKEGAQVNALGRLAGPRGHRVVQLQIVDKQGNAVQQLELPASF